MLSLFFSFFNVTSTTGTKFFLKFNSRLILNHLLKEDTPTSKKKRISAFHFVLWPQSKHYFIIYGYHSCDRDEGGKELNIRRGQVPDLVFNKSLQANLPFTHRLVQVTLDPLMFGAPFHWDCSICYCTHAVINKVCRCLQRFVLRCLYLNSELGCELPLRNREKDLTTHAFYACFYCFS